MIQMEEMMHDDDDVDEVFRISERRYITTPREILTGYLRARESEGRRYIRSLRNIYETHGRHIER